MSFERIEEDSGVAGVVVGEVQLFLANADERGWLIQRRAMLAQIFSSCWRA